MSFKELMLSHDGLDRLLRVIAKAVGATREI